MDNFKVYVHITPNNKLYFGITKMKSEAQKAQLKIKRLHEHNTGLKRTPKQIENIKAAKRRPKIEAEC